MPTYDYRCVDCGNRLEVFQSFADEPLTTCDVCGGRLKKVLYPVGIQFKGSGFYSTDRRAGPQLARSNNKETKTEEGSAAKSDGKREAKADGKVDSSAKEGAAHAPTKGAEKSA